MDGILRTLLLAGLAGFAQLVVSSGDAPVRAPYVEVGDCWNYHTAGVYYREWITSYEMCVTHIDRTKDVVLATARVNESDREIDLSFTMDWGCGTWINGFICEGPVKFLKFPLRVGDKHSVAFNFRNAVGENYVGSQQMEVEVTGWEDVTVPAGTFHAIKIVARGISAAGTRISRTWWYVPKVSRHVKFVQEARPNSWSEELTGYRLIK